MRPSYTANYFYAEVSFSTSRLQQSFKSKCSDSKTCKGRKEEREEQILKKRSKVLKKTSQYGLRKKDSKEKGSFSVLVGILQLPKPVQTLSPAGTTLESFSFFSLSEISFTFVAV